MKKVFKKIIIYLCILNFGLASYSSIEPDRSLPIQKYYAEQAAYNAKMREEAKSPNGWAFFGNLVLAGIGYSLTAPLWNDPRTSSSAFGMVLAGIGTAFTVYCAEASLIYGIAWSKDFQETNEEIIHKKLTKISDPIERERAALTFLENQANEDALTRGKNFIYSGLLGIASLAMATKPEEAYTGRSYLYGMAGITLLANAGGNLLYTTRAEDYAQYARSKKWDQIKVIKWKPLAKVERVNGLLIGTQKEFENSYLNPVNTENSFWNFLTGL